MTENRLTGEDIAELDRAIERTRKAGREMLNEPSEEREKRIKARIKLEEERQRGLPPGVDWRDIDIA